MRLPWLLETRRQDSWCSRPVGGTPMGSVAALVCPQSQVGLPTSASPPAQPALCAQAPDLHLSLVLSYEASGRGNRLLPEALALPRGSPRQWAGPRGLNPHPAPLGAALGAIGPHTASPGGSLGERPLQTHSLAAPGPLEPESQDRAWPHLTTGDRGLLHCGPAPDPSQGPCSAPSKPFLIEDY